MKTASNGVMYKKSKCCKYSNTVGCVIYYYQRTCWSMTYDICCHPTMRAGAERRISGSVPSAFLANPCKGGCTRRQRTKDKGPHAREHNTHTTHDAWRMTHEKQANTVSVSGWRLHILLVFLFSCGGLVWRVLLVAVTLPCNFMFVADQKPVTVHYVFSRSKSNITLYNIQGTADKTQLQQI